ncbi:Short chain dehydrogenase MYCFIDRAFT_6125 [Geodia barretti]|uniref:Short chain dehydrogenase MYCFIDRAFT_6125 n=1 Tax=Geodia barretti TaxID=519541 RepID=A0AA35W4W0_GEOBA|nr:Short chain dehydrogenase MYCFIDRAFT_6125 [Geodia barretti]
MLFAAEGGKVICAARTVEEGTHPLEGSLNTTIQEIRDAGGEATAAAANISLPEDCEALVQAAHDTYGPVDVLVNNAALTYFIPVKDYPLNRWMRSWAVNFHGPFILSQLVLEDMIPRGSGSIVNISSGAAIGPGRGPYQNVPPNSGGTCYGAEKAALERYSQGLAQEVYQYGISVTALSPSQVVPTPGTIFHNLVSGVDDPRGEHPELMAKASLLLATEPLDEVTGSSGLEARVRRSRSVLVALVVCSMLMAACDQSQPAGQATAAQTPAMADGERATPIRTREANRSEAIASTPPPRMGSGDAIVPAPTQSTPRQAAKDEDDISTQETNPIIVSLYHGPWSPEERIIESDTVARARLRSAFVGAAYSHERGGDRYYRPVVEFIYDVSEYLKGEWQ